MYLAVIMQYTQSVSAYQAKESHWQNKTEKININ